MTTTQPNATRTPTADPRAHDCVRDDESFSHCSHAGPERKLKPPIAVDDEDHVEC